MNILVQEARRFLFVREDDGPNRGRWVERFLRFTGNQPGDSWCAAFVSFLLDVVYYGRPPIIKSAGCDELLADCRKKGFIVTEPQEGDLVFSMNGTDAHHVAICTALARNMGTSIFTIAGNTSEDGVSSNGTGVFEHDVSRANKVYARLPKAA